MNRFKKWIDLGLALTALALWFLLRQMLEQVWEIFRLPLLLTSPIQLPALAALGVALIAFILVRRNTRVMVFLEEVTTELTKVTWPTGAETITSTGVIIVMVGICAVILFLFDSLWGTLTSSFLAL